MGFIIVITAILAVIAGVVGFIGMLDDALQSRKIGNKLIIAVLASILLGFTSYSLNSYENQAEAWQAKAGTLTNQVAKLEAKNLSLKSQFNAAGKQIETLREDLEHADAAVRDKAFKLSDAQRDLSMQKVEVSLLQAELKAERNKAKVDQKVVEVLKQANETLKESNENLQGKLDAINEAVGGTE